MDKDFDLEAQPIPEWAMASCSGGFVLGAQLPTRDGRRCGNAHIIEVVEGCLGMNKLVYTVLTDAGNTMKLTLNELEELFYPPMWMSDVDAVIRKFGTKE